MFDTSVTGGLYQEKISFDKKLEKKKALTFAWKANFFLDMTLCALAYNSHSITSTIYIVKLTFFLSSGCFLCNPSAENEHFRRC